MNRPTNQPTDRPTPLSLRQTPVPSGKAKCFQKRKREVHSFTNCCAAFVFQMDSSLTAVGDHIIADFDVICPEATNAIVDIISSAAPRPLSTLMLTSCKFNADSDVVYFGQSVLPHFRSLIIDVSQTSPGSASPILSSAHARILGPYLRQSPISRLCFFKVDAAGDTQLWSSVAECWFSETITSLLFAGVVGCDFSVVIRHLPRTVYSLSIYGSLIERECGEEMARVAPNLTQLRRLEIGAFSSHEAFRTMLVALPRNDFQGKLWFACQSLNDVPLPELAAFRRNNRATNVGLIVAGAFDAVALHRLAWSVCSWQNTHPLHVMCESMSKADLRSGAKLVFGYPIYFGLYPAIQEVKCARPIYHLFIAFLTNKNAPFSGIPVDMWRLLARFFW